MAVITGWGTLAAGQMVIVCEWCGCKFDYKLGRYGCPNCLGEGLNGENSTDTTDDNADDDQ